MNKILSTFTLATMLCLISNPAMATGGPMFPPTAGKALIEAGVKPMTNISAVKKLPAVVQVSDVTTPKKQVDTPVKQQVKTDNPNAVVKNANAKLAVNQQVKPGVKTSVSAQLAKEQLAKQHVIDNAKKLAAQNAVKKIKTPATSPAKSQVIVKPTPTTQTQKIGSTVPSSALANAQKMKQALEQQQKLKNAQSVKTVQTKQVVVANQQNPVSPSVTAKASSVPSRQIQKSASAPVRATPQKPVAKPTSAVNTQAKSPVRVISTPQKSEISARTPVAKQAVRTPLTKTNVQTKAATTTQTKSPVRNVSAVRKPVPLNQKTIGVQKPVTRPVSPVAAKQNLLRSNSVSSKPISAQAKTQAKPIVSKQNLKTSVKQPLISKK